MGIGSDAAFGMCFPDQVIFCIVLKVAADAVKGTAGEIAEDIVPVLRRMVVRIIYGCQVFLSGDPKGIIEQMRLLIGFISDKNVGVGIVGVLYEFSILMRDTGDAAEIVKSCGITCI